jgi:hypothetical protein
MAVRRLRTLAGLVVLLVASAPAPAWPEGDGDSGGPPVVFTAEVFATPSYHLLEIPKVEEGGEGFTWSYLNQTPESWGRALAFWPGPTGEATFGTSLPQAGPLAGHRWKSPGAWSSYPTGGQSRGLADFGEPRVPLGTTVDTPGGTMQLLSFSGRASAGEGAAETAFGSFQSSVAPVKVGFGRAYSAATREEGAALSSGSAVTHDVQIGDVSIAEIRSDASVRATAAGETGTWKLTIAGVTVAGQHLEWTDHGVSFAPGSEAPLQQLNTELAKGAEGFRSDFQLVPGRVWRDDAGTHVKSGFLEMGYRPVILENSPGQKMEYALSVVSARALYHPQTPEIDGPIGDGPAPPTGSAPATVEPGPIPAGGPGPAGSTGAPDGVTLGPALRSAYGESSGSAGGGDAGGSGGVASGVLSDDAAVPSLSLPNGRNEASLAVGGPGVGLTRAAPVATSFGRGAAHSLRNGIGLVALAGLLAAAAVMRAARRQLSLIGSSGEDA